MVKPMPICLGCVHFEKGNAEAMRCAAFPEGIPEEIVEGKLIHRKAYPGDNGMQYAPRVYRDASNIMYWKATDSESNTSRPYDDVWDIEEQAM